ncbi:TPA: DNRLRE domain-containing protein [Candidatus Woesearchaeota archaeon]|nr:DNRLRE domain-containing protein [Candidatus Woesearchaeota archaeon]
MAAGAVCVYGSTQTEIIYNMDDTYVNSSAGTTNYDANALSVQGANVESWFRFLLTDVTGKYITKASLYCYVAQLSATADFEIEETGSETWTETDLTWNNKPGKDLSMDITSISTTGWAYWDILAGYSSDFDSGLTYAGYAIKGGTNIRMEDKENTLGTAKVPYLNLTTMTPEVTADSPADPYSTYTTTVTFQYTTFDAGNIVNCSLILDGAVNMTNTTSQTNRTSKFKRTGIFPGSHTWSIRCYDVNRAAYQFNTETRDLDVLAKVEWYNPSSATPLDLGTAMLGEAEPTGSRQIRANNTNQNVQLTCSSGDCAVVTTDWSTTDMTSGQVLEADFNCSTATAGSYEAEYALTSDQDGTSDLLTINCTILAPDLRIDNVNVTFSPDPPSEAQTMTVTAGIYNDGSYGVTDAVVRFYEGDQLTGTQIGVDQLVTLGPGQSTTVQQNWTAHIGTFDMHVVLDPPTASGGSIEESDETNNDAYNAVEVSMWTLFVGNVTGWLVLGTYDDRTLIKWTVPDTTDSLLYIADTDSTIQFSALTAFGRDTGGDYMADDFLELDDTLNTTMFSDSINNTFISGGVPKSTRTFTVFGVDIEDVPIVESTNSSTFMTGILWDSSDDAGNGQYDNSTDEDVVFVTSVNKSKLGKYGIYDYEIKVPSRMKNYKGPDTQTVTLYSEIK